MSRFINWPRRLISWFINIADLCSACPSDRGICFALGCSGRDLSRLRTSIWRDISRTLECLGEDILSTLWDFSHLLAHPE